MTWPEKSLDELGFVGRGRSRHRPRDAEHLYGGPYPFIQTSDVKHANLYITEYSQTYSEAGLAQSKLWPEGTLCITIAANIADTAILAFDACFPDSVIGFVADENKADTRFVKYLFDAHLQMRYKKFTQGAAQDNLSQEKLLSLKFPVPNVLVQRKIADAIAVYDDLIENNHRRIDLLEQATRLLYKEWFVHFRFPGHEHVKVVGGVPEGWKPVPVKSLVKRIPAGRLFDQKTCEVVGSIPILDQGRSGIIGYHNEQPSVRASTEEPMVVFSNHTCYQRIIHFPFSCIQNVLPFEPSNIYDRNIYWLHYATSGLVKTNGYKGHWPELMAKQVLLPPLGLCNAFAEVVRNNHHMIYNLERQNRELRDARDLLLPRLMNGEIAI